MTDKPQGASITGLLEIMEALRHPDTGCPWDLEQSFETIAPYTIEEAYEVEDAIRSGDMEAFKSELGDLLFQTVFQAQIAKEANQFDFDDIVKTLSTKMISRHPHVFGNEAEQNTAEEQKLAWEDRKAAERADKAARLGRPPSVLDDVPLALPALMRAEKLQKRAARIGFDWNDIGAVYKKVLEEAEELSKAKDSEDQSHVHEEFGDLLFVVVNLARHLKLDPETALRDANAKFERRFRYVETQSADKGTQGDLEAMEALWQEAKRLEK